jgi:hypothetical protein
VKPTILLFSLVLAAGAVSACGGKESLKEIQAARRAQLAGQSQTGPLSAKRTINHRTGLIGAGGRPVGQTFTQLFGKPQKGVTTKVRPPAPVLPASTLFDFREPHASAAPALPARNPASRPPATLAVAPDSPADPLSAFSTSSSRKAAAEKRPPQISSHLKKRY